MADDKLFHSFKIIGDPKSIYKKIMKQSGYGKRRRTDE